MRKVKIIRSYKGLISEWFNVEREFQRAPRFPRQIKTKKKKPEKDVRMQKQREAGCAAV